jgi:hypothetical protein
LAELVLSEQEKYHAIGLTNLPDDLIVVMAQLSARGDK